MKKIVVALMLAAVSSVYAKELKEFVVTTDPQMVCHNCEAKIKGNMRFEKGVKKVETDLDNQIVTITYDAEKTDEKKLAEAFRKLKYDVRKVTVDTTSVHPVR